MGKVISLSEPSLDAFLYGNKGNILNSYLMQQMQNVQPAFNEFSQRVFNAIQSSYNFVNDKLTQYGILNELSNKGLMALDNHFAAIDTFEGLQQASLTMQRWIMCHPELRQLYVDQNVDGYSDTYRPLYGKEVKENDYDYRRVMDGVIVDSNDSFKYSFYMDELIGADRELNHFEKVQILHTHDYIDHVLNTCSFDFTSKSKKPPKINRS